MKPKNNRAPRGSSTIFIAFGATVMLTALGSANVMWSELKERRAFRAVQEATAKEANQGTIELVARLFENNLLVGFYAPDSPPEAKEPPAVPKWEQCNVPNPPSSCQGFLKCSDGPHCQEADLSSEGENPPSSKAELQAACNSTLPLKPNCKGICAATDCKQDCGLANLKNCDNICEAADTCENRCEDAIPPDPPCKLCIPDPESESGCKTVKALPTIPPLKPPQIAEGETPEESAFEMTKGVFLTYDDKKLKALPHGAKFKLGFLEKSRLERKIINPRNVEKVQQVADQQLVNGAYVGDAGCAADPKSCLPQETVFGNVVKPAPGAPGSLEVITTTDIPTTRFTTQGIRTRARISANIGPAPLPQCQLNASPPVVYSHFSYEGNMWTTLSLSTSVTPDFPGLISGSNLAGVKYSPDGGSRVVPYPYGATQFTYHATVSGPGGSNDCSVTVRSVCMPRAPVCVPKKCWYPVDNFPRCAGWLVCPHGKGCWWRGEVLGCFAPDTNLAVSETELRKVSTLSTGNVLWNPVTKTAVAIKTRIVGPEAGPLVEIGYGDKRIRVSSQHPIVTKRGLLRADQVQKSDELQGEDLAFHKITHLALGKTPATKHSQTVINFEIDTPSTRPEDHYLLADGIVVGDYFLQNQLAGRNPASVKAKKKPAHEAK